MIVKFKVHNLPRVMEFTGGISCFILFVILIKTFQDLELLMIEVLSTLIRTFVFGLRSVNLRRTDNSSTLYGCWALFTRKSITLFRRDVLTHP